MRPLTAVWPAGAGSGEADMPTVTVSVLQFGSGHTRRELAHIQRRGIDKRHSFTLDVRLLANLSASRLAVSSTSVDGAVARVVKDFNQSSMVWTFKLPKGRVAAH